MVARVRGMIASANEVMALASKAARGSGYPPGQADNFGRAALHHLRAGRPAADLLAALALLPGGPIIDAPLWLAAALEQSTGATAEARVPEGAWAALFLSYAEAQPFKCVVLTDVPPARLQFVLEQPALHILPPRLELPEALVTDLQLRAARTYVPETEASRLSGAGAGLTDND